MANVSFEQRCIAINNTLKGLPKGRTEKAIYHHVFEPGLITRMYRRRKVFYCSECGSEIGVLTQKVCPVCHAKWKAETTEDRKGTERYYHMELEAKGDIQLCRIYRVERHTWYGKAASINVWEVERIMYAPTGERRVFSRGIQCMSWYYDAFCYGPIKLKREYRNMGNSAELRYNLDMSSWHIRSLTEQWRYKDVHSLLNLFHGDSSVLRVIAYPYAETMLKTGQEKLFKYLVNEIRLLPRGAEHAINICTRNHYKINDPSMWLDHLEMLCYLRLDTHNAHYVCPDDLSKAHSELLVRKRKVDEKRRAERELRANQRKLKRMEKEKQSYAERWGKALEISLKGKNLSVRPLQSVDEFAAEGAAMHHCVFANEYYKKPNMILSAKDGDGNRLATIEYNIRKGTIVQCRAACNQVPARDAEIRRLITRHRNDFQRLLKAAA